MGTKSNIEKLNKLHIAQLITQQYITLMASEHKSVGTDPTESAAGSTSLCKLKTGAKEEQIPGRKSSRWEFQLIGGWSERTSPQ